MNRISLTNPQPDLPERARAGSMGRGDVASQLGTAHGARQLAAELVVVWHLGPRHDAVPK